MQLLTFFRVDRYFFIHLCQYKFLLRRFRSFQKKFPLWWHGRKLPSLSINWYDIHRNGGGKLGEGDVRPKAPFADSLQLAAMIGRSKAAFKKHRHMCGLILQGYVCWEKKFPISCMNGSCHVLPDDVSAAKGKAKLSYKSAQIHILTPFLFDTNNVSITRYWYYTTSVSTFHLRKITLLGVP